MELSDNEVVLTEMERTGDEDAVTYVGGWTILKWILERMGWCGLD
jgi:hypothetical protein